MYELNLTRQSRSFALAHLDNQKPCSTRFWLPLIFIVRCVMKRKYVWLIASITIITVPLAFRIIGTPDTTFKEVLVYLSFSPIAIAVIMELAIDYKQEVTNKGSPIGNKLAKILGAILFIGVVAIVIRMANT